MILDWVEQFVAIGILVATTVGLSQSQLSQDNRYTCITLWFGLCTTTTVRPTGARYTGTQLRCDIIEIYMVSAFELVRLEKQPDTPLC